MVKKQGNSDVYKIHQGHHKDILVQEFSVLIIFGWIFVTFTEIIEERKQSSNMETSNNIDKQMFLGFTHSAVSSSLYSLVSSFYFVYFLLVSYIC